MEVKKVLPLYYQTNNKKTTIMKVKFEPGTYYIGDPCYAFENHDEWIDLLQKNNYFSNEEATQWKDGVVWGASTAHGDGNYSDNRSHSRFSYPVDAGVIGVTSINICDFGETEWDAENRQWVKKGTKELSIFQPGNVFTFVNPFYASCEDGFFEIGNSSERMIEIETDEMDEDEQDEDYWDNEEEDKDYWDNEEEDED